MNTVGKLLIVLQMFLAIMFMAFAGAVYQTQTNWKAAHDRVQESLTVAQANVADEQAKRSDEQEAYNDERKELITARDNFEATANGLAMEKADLTARLAASEGANAAFQTEAELASNEAAARLAESNALREEVRKLRARVDTLIAEVRQQDDSILELSRLKAAAIEKDKIDQQRIAQLENVLRLNRIPLDTKVNENGELLADGREPDELVSGKVMRAERNQSGSLEYVHVSIGQDDGLEVGHRLHIYRGRDFICDIILREVGADDAVGVVDERLRNGVIQRGDNVTSKL